MDIYSSIQTTDKYLRMAIIEAHNSICFYTKEIISLDNFHIDHIIPKSRKWEDCIANYLPASSWINLKKNTMLNDKISEIRLINEGIFAPIVLKHYLKLVKTRKTKTNIDWGIKEKIKYERPLTKIQIIPDDAFLNIATEHMFNQIFFSNPDNVFYSQKITYPDWTIKEFEVTWEDKIKLQKKLDAEFKKEMEGDPIYIEFNEMTDYYKWENTFYKKTGFMPDPDDFPIREKREEVMSLLEAL